MLSSVRDLRALERLEPARFTAALAAELSASDDSLATLTAQLDGLHEALLAIEDFSRRAMDLRLTFVLAHEPVPPQLRRLISATVVTYEDDLALMEKRFERYLPIAVLDKILIAAQQVL